MSQQDPIIQELEKFCSQEITSFFNAHKDTIPYPSDIVRQLSELGLFGINIPEEFGGSKLPISLNLEINRVLSKYWLAIPALYGTHLRANQYYLELGNPEQKSTMLPKMASGEQITAHAFHEKGKKQPATFATNVKRNGNSYILNGEKEWVTNAENATQIIVVA